MTYDDLIAELRRWSDRIRFAEIVREEAKRTVLVPGPASAVKLEAWLAAHGLDDVITVQMSQFLPADTWYVIDEQAIEAGQAEALQAMRRTPLFGHRFDPVTWMRYGWSAPLAPGPLVRITSIY